ncbi:hypothetical protein EIP91_009331 [Steccherinum ochraceum]|uniref:Uncharacterized protein n=1 Tax=Steccherinum ochraceum TaxID=92696 RepID=A0A4R0RKD6_9APHY|nr:hypothetical protein EIP91_009331 [Steccherinum ochraceum]
MAANIPLQHDISRSLSNRRLCPQVLDAQLQECDQAMTSLKSKRNALALINRLPPELLALIFHCCQDILDSTTTHRERYYRSTSQTTSPCQWTVIFRICHHWRSIALDTATLWNTIQLDNISTATRETFLARSKTAPLQLDAVGFDDQRDTELLQIALPLLSRAHSIEFTLGEAAYATTSTLGLFPPSLPNLKHLSLYSRSRKRQSDGQLPIFLTQCSTPALKTLRMAYYTLPWTVVRLPDTLTELMIDSPPVGVTVLELIGAIRDLQDLQDLTLINVFPPVLAYEEHDDGSVIIPEATTRLEFNRLRTLCIEADVIPCVHFLDHLSALPPTGTTLDLTVGQEREYTTALSRLGSMLPAVDVDSMTLDNSGILFYRSASKSIPSDVTSHGPAAGSRIHLTFPPDPHDEIISAANALASNALTSINHLSFHSVRIHHSLKTLFEQLPSLKTLTFKTYPEGIGSAFEDALSPSSSRTLKLKSLTFDAVSFADCQNPDGCPDFVLHLPSLLAAGCEIKRIVIRECTGVQSVDVVELRRFVEEMEYVRDDESAGWEDGENAEGAA